MDQVVKVAKVPVLMLHSVLPIKVQVVQVVLVAVWEPVGAGIVIIGMDKVAVRDSMVRPTIAIPGVEELVRMGTSREKVARIETWMPILPLGIPTRSEAVGTFTDSVGMVAVEGFLAVNRV